MKKVDIQISERVKTTILMAGILIFVLLILPLRNAGATGFWAATLFTIIFYLYPNRFQDRDGSLRLAYCLLVFVWICAVVAILFS